MTQSQFAPLPDFEFTPEIRRARRKYPHGLTPPKLAALIGVSGRAVARRCELGQLPFMDHGPKKHLIQWPVVELVLKYGLGGVERMVQAGRL